MVDISISSIMSKVKSKGFLDPTKYQVMITGPLGTLGQDDSIYCSATSLPGRSVGTVERYDHGPIRKVPYAEIYADLSLTFMCSGNMTEHKFFDLWQTFCVGGDDFYLPYYDDIVGNIRLNLIDKQGSITMTMEAREAWPVMLSEVQLGYDEMGTVPKFSVDFAYHSWTSK